MKKAKKARNHRLKRDVTKLKVDAKRGITSSWESKYVNLVKVNTGEEEDRQLKLKNKVDKHWKGFYNGVKNIYDYLNEEINLKGHEDIKTTIHEASKLSSYLKKIKKEPKSIERYYSNVIKKRNSKNKKQRVTAMELFADHLGKIDKKDVSASEIKTILSKIKT
tara:strand:+ start:39 stop:530 length:492 start_codon:yes stop_codon:yes gene_type:complete